MTGRGSAPPPTLAERAAGVLLHPSSLPGPGIGSIGECGRRWVDWLAGAGQRVWQILPLVPTGDGGSPYDGLSAFAGNPWLIDLQPLAEAGLLDPAQIRAPGFPDARVDYARLARWKEPLLREAFAAWGKRAGPAERGEAADFRERSRDWLDDYALFRALRAEQGDAGWAGWAGWEPGLRARVPDALHAARERLREEVELHVWQQWTFAEQWQALHRYATERGIAILGDIPIFVAHDSADVWAHPELFRLDGAGKPTVVSGVPPDYFSETGQRWGNPLYRWDAMEGNGFVWWTERVRNALHRVDALRVDHFRGFEAAWEIPADQETAVNGEWRPGPGRALFDRLRDRLGSLPLVAEDLGLITREVEALRDELGLPGMRVLQFAWDGSPDNPHLPANTPPEMLAYTGTHDNDTAAGWLRDGASEAERERFLQGSSGFSPEPHWAMIEMALGTRARWAVIPAQDVLGLGSDARMNTPGVADGNWSWRLPDGIPSAVLAGRLRRAAAAAERAVPLSSPTR